MTSHDAEAPPSPPRTWAAALYSFIFHCVLVPPGALPVWKTIVLFSPMISFLDEYTKLGDPVAFQYPSLVSLFGFPPLALFSSPGMK